MPIPSDTKVASYRQQPLIEVIAAGDPDALAGYYDSRAANVLQYCTEICSPRLVDEAVLSAFTDFVGRARTQRGDPDDLLRKSTRAAAASRMQLVEARESTCWSIPELLAARTNKELRRGEGQLERHLSRCPSCNEAARRLTQAEDALIRPATKQPAQYVRSTFLQIAAREVPAEVEPPIASEPTATEVRASEVTSPGVQATGERRRGGRLLGAARRLASARRRP